MKSFETRVRGVVTCGLLWSISSWSSQFFERISTLAFGGDFEMAAQETYSRKMYYQLFFRIKIPNWRGNQAMKKPVNPTWTPTYLKAPMNQKVLKESTSA